MLGIQLSARTVTISTWKFFLTKKGRNILVWTYCMTHPPRMLQRLMLLLNLITANPNLRQCNKTVNHTGNRILNSNYRNHSNYLEIPTIWWASNHLTSRMEREGRNSSIPIQHKILTVTMSVYHLYKQQCNLTNKYTYHHDFEAHKRL